MSTTPPAGEQVPARPAQHHSDDEHLLHRLGYAQELFRAMGGFQNFAISFTIISILAGCLTSYFIAFGNGGPVAVTWGWLWVGLMSTIIALAMAEIASTYPTAGGLYYWASRLGSPGWGWFTGWFNLIGQIAVTAAIGMGLAIFATALLNFWFEYPNTEGWIFVTYTAVMAIAVALNMFRVSITAFLNTISAYWHMVGVAVVVLVLIVVPDHHRSLGYVFGETVNASGYGATDINFSNPIFWFVFGLGLLMAQYTITGFDASAHLAEETRQASRGAAVGMYMSVVASVIFGFILLVAVTAAVPSTDGALENIGFMVPWIWQESMSQTWAELLLFIAVVAQMFCLTASVTSASRMMFAFSRDGAVPGHRIWRRIASNRVPRYSVFAIGVLSWILMIPVIWNFLIGYAVGTSIAVIGLYIAFILPVILRFRLGERFERGAWSLGRHYRWIDLIAIAWVAIITVLFLLPLYKAGVPWEDDFTWEAANYAPLTVGGALLLFGGWYALSAKNWFKGPVRMGTEEELERIEERYERQTGLPAEAGS